MRRLATVAALTAGLLIPAGADAASKPTRGDDRIVLGAGDDKVNALAGNDLVAGRKGADTLRGAAGNDRLVGGPDADSLAGGPGDDVIRADDGEADTLVSGGEGEDRCVVDESDRGSITSCETVTGIEPGNSVAYSERNWQPTARDTCSKSLHDSFYAVGPDGKRYPTWHPPAMVDPETGERCSFGHEHGPDPAGSDIYDWAVENTSSADFPQDRGLPFGYVSEQLEEYRASNPGFAARHEDHVGHKIDFVNDVRLLDERGATVPGEDGEPVTCDYLFKVHQGSHSIDALTNNAHELIYASRCSDGSEIMASTMSTFGDGGEYNRSCAPEETVQTAASSPFPSGEGMRLLPDRECAEEYVLVSQSNPNAYSSLWAMYENWRSENVLETSDGEQLAFYDPWFAVVNPSRYATGDAANGIGIARMHDLAYETEANGDRANRAPWSPLQTQDPFTYDDPASPFDGAQREFYLGETELTNADGPRRWYTDPYGRNGSPTPFPGGVCQIIGSVDNSDRPELRQRLYRRDTDLGEANGVHAPN